MYSHEIEEDVKLRNYIVNIKEYNEQLYIKIKSLEKKLKKNNN